MSGPGWLLPSPGNGYSSVPASEQASQEARFYGSDVWFDVSKPDEETGEADYVTTPDGDLTLVTGREALRQSLIRRLITEPGEWAMVPEYGVGAVSFVKAKNSPATRAELESRIRSQFLRDPRVHSVDIVTVTPLDDGSPGVKISIQVTPKGRLRTDKPLSVQLEIR